MDSLGHYFKVGKLIWAEGGGSILVYLFNGEKLVFAGYVFHARIKQLLEKQIEIADLYFRSETISAAYVEIPKNLLEL